MTDPQSKPPDCPTCRSLWKQSIEDGLLGYMKCWKCMKPSVPRKVIMEWSDQQGDRDRRAWLLFITEGVIHRFRGETIEGVVVVTGSSSKKEGKWSHTIYRLRLFPSVVAIPGHMGWEQGTTLLGELAAATRSRPLDTWGDLAGALGVSVTETRRFFLAWGKTGTIKVLDDVEEALKALDVAAEEADASDIETVRISFGSPTRRQRAAGFWVEPKEVGGYEGATVVLVDPDPDRYSEQWKVENLRLLGIEGRVLKVETSSGYGGGYVTITVAVIPPGPAKTEPEPGSAPMMVFAGMKI